MRIFCAAVLVSFALAQPARAQFATTWRLVDGGLVHPEYRGPVPKNSDVVFSTRFQRWQALEAVKEFRATRVEWGYASDRAFIERIIALSGWYGGAVHSTMPLPSDSGLARDFNANPITPPEMPKSWNAKVITTTHEETRSVLKQEAKKFIALGAKSLQVDDPLLQLRTVDWGGDFSTSTVAGFRKFLSALPDKTHLLRLGISNIDGFDYARYLRTLHGVANAEDYRRRYRSIPSTELWQEYIRQTVRDHFVDYRHFLNMQAGRVFPLSMNLNLLNRPNESNPQFFRGIL